MPSSFTVSIPGEGKERNFKFDVNEKALYTDLGGVIANPNSALNPDMDALVGELKIKQGSDGQFQALLDGLPTPMLPLYETYWNETFLHREAYRICEEEDVSLEEAYDRVGTTPTGESSDPPPKSYPPPTQQRPEYGAPDNEELPPAVDTTTAIVIANYQMISQGLCEMLEGYVEGDDSESAAHQQRMFAFFKGKLEETDGYEIHI